MEMVKGLLVGAVLTFVVALVLGSQGSQGAFLHIRGMEIMQVHLWWSWPLFLASSAIAWSIAAMMK